MKSNVFKIFGLIISILLVFANAQAQSYSTARKISLNHAVDVVDFRTNSCKVQITNKGSLLEKPEGTISCETIAQLPAGTVVIFTNNYSYLYSSDSITSKFHNKIGFLAYEVIFVDNGVLRVGHVFRSDMENN